MAAGGDVGEADFVGEGGDEGVAAGGEFGGDALFGGGEGGEDEQASFGQRGLPFILTYSGFSLQMDINT